VKEYALGAPHRRMRRIPPCQGDSGEVFWAQTMACVLPRVDFSDSRDTARNASFSIFA